MNHTRIVRVFSLFLACALLFAAAPPAVSAGEILDSGVCGDNGDNLTWTLDDAGLLTISGTGGMGSFFEAEPLPWEDYRSEIRTAVIGPGVTGIGSGSFANCYALEHVEISGSVVSIEESAFEGCTGLAELTLPDSVTSISYSAFCGCTSLAEITVPDSVTSIDEDAFAGTAWYAAQPEGLVYAGKVAYRYKGEMPENTEIALAPGTVGIAAGAFENCEGLSDISFPESLTDVGYRALDGTAWYAAQPEGPVYAGTVFYRFKGTPAQTSVVLAAGTAGIAAGAFSYGGAIAEVTVPESTARICTGAFSSNGVKTVYVLSPACGIAQGGIARDIVIFGLPGSTAEAYAAANGNRFFEAETKAVTGICVNTPPRRTVFTKGTGFDPEGFTLLVTYEDGTEAVRAAWSALSGFAPYTVGEQTVTVTYYGAETTFAVTVIEPGDVDGDGLLTAADARLALRISEHPEETFSDQALAAADMDQSGDVSAEDADRISVCASQYAHAACNGYITGCGFINENAALFTQTQGGLQYAFEKSTNLELNVVLFAKDCAGMEAADFVLTYDPAVLRYTGAANRSEKNRLNAVSAVRSQINTQDPGELSGGVYFKEALREKEIWTQADPSLADIDFSALGLVVLKFRKLSEGDPQIAVRSILHGEPAGYYTAEAPLADTGFETCAHGDTVAAEAAAPACAAVGYTAGVYCRDCREYLSGHAVIPSLGHTDADTNGVCDVCGESTAPAIAVIQQDTRNGYIKVGLNMMNCVGLESIDLRIRFDPDVLRPQNVDGYYAQGGKDVNAQRPANNPLIWGDNKIQSEIIYVAYFKNELWGMEELTARAGENAAAIPADHNPENFEFALIEFKILNEEAQTALTVSGSIHFGENQTEVSVVAAPALCRHCFGDWETVWADCTQPGTKTQTCTFCGAARTESVPARGAHAMAPSPNSPETPATCAEPGERTLTCTVCGFTQTETIPATGEHIAGEPAEIVMLPAACVSAGEKRITVRCTACGGILSETTEEIPAAGHSDADGNGRCDVCGELMPGAEETGEICRWCSRVHDNSILGRITKILHDFAYFFAHLLGRM